MGFLAASWRQIWLTLVTGLVLTALYTSLGRQLIPMVETWRPDLEQILTEQLGKPVEIGQLQGGWRYVSPVIRLTDVSIGDPADRIRIDHLQLELDPARTAFYRLPVFSRIEVRGVHGHLRREGDLWFIGQRWALQSGSGQAAVTAAGTVPASGSPLWVQVLERQERIYLQDWNLALELKPGQIEHLAINNLLWLHRNGRQLLSGSLSVGGSEQDVINLNASLDGALWPWGKQSGSVYVELTPQALERWIPDNLPQDLHVESLNTSASLWLTLTDGKLRELYADLGIQALQLSTRASPLSITNGRIQIGGVHNGDDWHLRVLPELGDKVPLHNLTVSLVNLPDETGWQIGIPSLQLGDAVRYLLEHGLLPDPFDRYLTHINPSGLATDVRVSLLNNRFQEIDVRARLQGVASSAYQGIPGVTGVDADLHLQPFQGVVDIYHQPLVLDLKGVYETPWQIDDLTSRVYWQIGHDESRIQVTGLQARSGAIELRGELALHLPSSHSHREGYMALLLGVPNATAVDRQRLVPDLLDQGVRDWMATAIRKAHFSNGVFLLNGNLSEKHPLNSLTTQLYMDIAEGELAYMESWPLISDLSGSLALDSPDLDISLASASTLGGRLLKDSGRIRLSPDKNNVTRLIVTGQMQGPVSEAIAYFQTTPLQEVVQHNFDSWSGKGLHRTSFNISMPLGVEVVEPRVKLDSRLVDTSVRIGDLALDFSELQGPLQFDSVNGLASKELMGKVMGGAFRASLTSEAVNGGGFKSLASIEGRASMEAYKRWSPVFLLDPVTGDLGYNARLNLNTATGNLLFDLETALDGTRIDYPAPLGKAADDSAHRLRVKVKPGRETRITMTYDKLIQAVFALDQQGINRGQVYMGGGEAFLPSDSGIEIRGNLTDTIRAEEWWDMWQRLLPLVEASAPTVSTAAGGKAAEPEQNPLRSVDLVMSSLKAWTLDLGESHVTSTQSWGEWQFGIDSQMVKGGAVMKPDNSPVAIKLDYVHMPPAEDAGPGPGANATSTDLLKAFRKVLDNDSLKDMVPADLLPMDVEIGEFFLGGWNLGAWKLTSRPEAEGLHVNVVEGLMKGMTITGDMYWTLGDWGHRTRLEGFQLRGKDLAAVQKAFRQDVIVDGKSFKASANLSWMGSPLAFNTYSLDGQASVRIDNGTWKTEGGGALKAFGMLNFNSISRRLQLDFSDLYQSGVAFDVTRAKVSIDNGLLTFVEPLVVDGPGAKFLASGTTSLNNQALDLKLAVTFPVTGSLPVAAVLAGFAPAVAVYIYVTEKLIGDELERFTSASYDIKGTWSEPKMKIKQAFDNDVDGKQTRSFKDRFLSIFGMEESK